MQSSDDPRDAVARWDMQRMMDVAPYSCSSFLKILENELESLG